MPVGINREPDRVMPKLVSDVRQVLPALDQEGGVDMSECMRFSVAESSPLQEGFPTFCRTEPGVWGLPLCASNSSRKA